MYSLNDCLDTVRAAEKYLETDGADLLCGMPATGKGVDLAKELGQVYAFLLRLKKDGVK